MTSAITLIPVALLLAVSDVSARSICYDGYGRRYYCNNGLSNGARIGIGIGIAVGVAVLFALCGYWRRRNLRNQFSKYRPPPLPVTNQQNQYANNPPPPTGGGGGVGGGSANQYYQGSNYNGNPYGNNPAPPAQTYQPSTAAQYKAPNATTPAVGETQHEHGYEWEQAREQERLEREAAAAGGGGVGGGDLPPPGYEVATSTHNTGNTTSGYAPPPGPPPGKTARGVEGAV